MPTKSGWRMSTIEPEVRASPSSLTTRLQRMPARMLGVASVRSTVFLELKQDRSRLANGEALLVVLLVGLSLGLGTAIAFNSTDAYSILGAISTSILLVLLTTTVWTGVIFLIGTRIFKGSTDFLGLARPVFFSVTPGLLFVFTGLLFSIASASIVREIVSGALSLWIIMINVFIAKSSMNLTSQTSILTIFVSACIMVIGAGTLGL